MLVIPRRKIWTPFDSARRKWNQFLEKFQLGKMQRGPNGKMRRNASGKLVRNNADSQACCCGESVYKLLTCCDDADEGIYVRGTPGTTYVVGGLCYYIPEDAVPESPEPDPGDIVEPTDIRPGCVSCAYTRARRCSDDAYSDIWRPGCPELSYFRQGGVCYYTDTDHEFSVTGEDPGDTAYNPDVVTIDDCDDTDCCEGLSCCSTASVTATISGWTACCRPVFPNSQLITSGTINGTFSLTYVSTTDNVCRFEYCADALDMTTYPTLDCTGSPSSTVTYPMQIVATIPTTPGGTIQLRVQLRTFTGTPHCSNLLGGIVAFNNSTNCFKSGGSISNFYTLASCAAGLTLGYGGSATLTWEC